MLRKTLVFTLCIIFSTGAVYAQKNLVIKERVPVYAQMDLPMPQDPVTGGVMDLSDSDMQLKKNADGYLKREDYGSAIGEVNKMSNEWARHTFLSFIYERQKKYRQAVAEIDWLIDNCKEPFLEEQLINRKWILANMPGQDRPEPGEKAVFFN